MSYSVYAIGTPDALIRRLEKESEDLTGLSKQELDEVLPAVKTIIGQNVGSLKTIFNLRLSGHANFKNGQKEYGQCNMELKTIGILVE